MPLNFARSKLVMACCLAAASSSTLDVSAQTKQKVTGPQARYWLSAETGTGFAAAAQSGGGGFFSSMGAALGGGNTPRKSMLLELDSARDANPATAEHTIPPSLSMGTSLPLLGSVPEPRGRDRDVPEMDRNQGNMRILFFWGCGEKVGAGQPVILDMAQMSNGQVPPNMRGVTVNAGPRSPGASRERGFAGWPNSQNSKQVPASASLVGNHQVRGGHIPEINFSVSEQHDYMAAVTLSQQASSAGLRLSWNGVPTATGFFATAMGMKSTGQNSSDMVMWNSSSERMAGGAALMDYLPPAEVERLVRARVVMPSSTTECTVPQAVQDAAGGQLLMANLNAFGPELDVIQPPRPQDVRVEWKKEYAVKVRQRSHASVMLALGGGSTRAGRDGKPEENKPKEGLDPGSLLKGIFGR